MASSLSSSSAVSKCDVFVSFRGEDVRRTFASHLFRELERAAIDVFRDDLDLERGKSISPELVDAIKSSRCAIVVVSENYAGSTWCLDELLKIMECRDSIGKRVVPIFYGVDPSDVRKQTGSVGEAIARHKDEERVRKWKEVLTELGSISGEHSRNWKNDSELIEKIVNEVSNHLAPPSANDDDDAEDLIGMSAHRDLLQLKRSTEDVRMIGICGMGGVGKTTIARYLYYHSLRQFQHHCFMDNVKDFYSRHGELHLQEEFLSKLIRSKDKGAWSSDHLCSNIIKGRFRNRRVLIVLDDVDKQEQLNALVKETDWFGPGSRIIITTRNKHLLVSHGVESVQEVECLAKDEALRLFRRYAFRDKTNPDGFQELAVQAVNYASGLPLALKVLGSFLCKRSIREWENTLAKLQKNLHKDIMEVMRVSYDGLDEEQKNIYLYISCLFNRKRVYDAKRFLDICGYATETDVKVLVEKSLMDVSFEYYIIMHDLLEQMGQELIRSINPGERVLLSDPEDIRDLLIESSGTQKVETISLNMCGISEICASDRAFIGLSNLKILDLYDNISKENKIHLPSGLCYLPRKLRYVRWDGYPLKTMPSTFRPEFLVELCLRNSHLHRLWTGTQPLFGLKKLDLSGCKYLVEAPDLSTATNLEELNLSHCLSLVEFPISIKNLHELYSLDTSHCIQLKNIPSGITLKSLKILRLSRCISLEGFPSELCETMNCLEWLDLDKSGVKELPDNIGCLISLARFEARETSIRHVPLSITRLTHLEVMSIGHRYYDPSATPSPCPCLSQFGELTVLRLCNLNLLEIPSSIGTMRLLWELDLSGNNFEVLPQSIKGMSMLETLCINNCQRLKALPKLPRVWDVYAHGCILLESISRCFTNRCCIKSLVVSNCFKLDQDELLLLHRHMQLYELSRKFTIFPGRDVPSCFNHQSSMASIKINLLRADCAPEFKAFYACVMVGFEGPYPMEHLSIRCRCRVRGSSDDEQVIMDEVWDPNPQALRGMLIETDHLLYFCRSFISGISYGEISFEFSLEGPHHDSRTLGNIKKCAVHLISTQDVEMELDKLEEDDEDSEMELMEFEEDDYMEMELEEEDDDEPNPE